jgi:ATP-dependent DNA ligase
VRWLHETCTSRLPIDDVILDGEITALDRHGFPDFEALQRAVHEKEAGIGFSDSKAGRP